MKKYNANLLNIDKFQFLWVHKLNMTPIMDFRLILCIGSVLLFYGVILTMKKLIPTLNPMFYFTMF